MQTKSINIIVREALMNKGYPIHYYLPFLHHALTCMDQLSFDFNFGRNVKEDVITITSYDRGVLPGDCIDVISVFGLYGGERRNFSLNESLTEIQKMNGATKVSYSNGENTLPKYDDFGSSALVQQGSASELPTIFYPTKDNIYEYNTDYSASEIILTPGHGLTTAYIRYLSNSIGNTSANLVNPYVTPVLFAYIDWMVAKGDGSPQSKVALLEDVYYNQKRILRGRMNPLSLSEMYRILITN